MCLVTRYILKYILLSTALVTAGLTVTVWMTQSLRLLDVLINRGVALTTFLKMILFLVPDLVGIILPIALVIGTLFTFSRFYADQELVVLKTLGLSHLRLARGPLVVALLVMAVLYAINFYFMPAAFQKLKDKEHLLRNKISSMIVTPGDFKTLKGLTVYVRDRRPNGALYGLLIHDARGENPLTLVAEKGVLKESASGLHLTLFRGSRQEVGSKTGKPAILSFESYALEFSSSTLLKTKRQRKPYEYFLIDLLKAPRGNLNPSLATKLKVELHQRLIMPLTSLSFVLVVMGIFLGGDYDRRGRTHRIVASIVYCVVIELGALGLLNLGERSFWFVILAYSLVLGSALTGALFLSWERLSFRNFINFKRPLP